MNIPNDVDFADYLIFVGEQESQEIHWAGHWRDSLADRIANGFTAQGEKLPWAKSHECIRLRAGELSIWAGINGHRKSMILGQVMAWLALKSKVCIASLEMTPEATLQRMLTQSAGCSPSVGYVNGWLDWADSQIAVYDELDGVEQERILGMAHYAARELGCKHIVIDSLTKCGIAGDDYNAQKKFVDKLAWAAKSTGAHIHLVCHMRKGKSEDEKPGKFDVRGASEITDLADNVFVCWKNKKREEASKKLEMGNTLTDAETKAIDQGCDQILSVAKQRHGEWEGDIRLWFHGPSLQFTPDARNHPLPFEI